MSVSSKRKGSRTPRAGKERESRSKISSQKQSAQKTSRKKGEKNWPSASVQASHLHSTPSSPPPIKVNHDAYPHAQAQLPQINVMQADSPQANLQQKPNLLLLPPTRPTAPSQPSNTPKLLILPRQTEPQEEYVQLFIGENEILPSPPKLPKSPAPDAVRLTPGSADKLAMTPPATPPSKISGSNMPQSSTPAQGNKTPPQPISGSLREQKESSKRERR